MKHIAMLALMCIALHPAASAEQYPAAFIVTETAPEQDVLELTDASGNTFECFGIEDWVEGDIAAAIMDDSGTPDDITDDEIIQLRYAGYTY